MLPKFPYPPTTNTLNAIQRFPNDLIVQPTCPRQIRGSFPDIGGSGKKYDRKFLTFLKFEWTLDRDDHPGIDNVRQSIGEIRVQCLTKPLKGSGDTSDFTQIVVHGDPYLDLETEGVRQDRNQIVGRSNH